MRRAPDLADLPRAGRVLRLVGHVHDHARDVRGLAARRPHHVDARCPGPARNWLDEVGRHHAPLARPSRSGPRRTATRPRPSSRGCSRAEGARDGGFTGVRAWRPRARRRSRRRRSGPGPLMPRAGVAAQEEDERGHLLGGEEALLRAHVRQAAPRFRPRSGPSSRRCAPLPASSHRRVDVARADRVHGHARGRHLEGGALGQAEHAVLAGGVGADVGIARLARDGGQVDDAPPAARASSPAALRAGSRRRR